MFRTGLIGRAIKASRSPWLHEQEARAQGLELTYELFDFNERGLGDEQLGPWLRDLAAQGYAGVNVTYPFKQAVLPLLDELADCARAVGAVNTVSMRGGRLIGYNTDKSGFQQGLAEHLSGAELGSVLQLGAGGAGAAVAIALLDSGAARLEISDVDIARSEALADRLSAIYPQCQILARNCAALDTSSVRGIVNTTPMGMAANPEPAIDPDLIQSHHWVADIVYFPLETEFLRIARAKGCRAMNGSGMVVGQAARAFEIFTGSPADKQRMARSFSAS